MNRLNNKKCKNKKMKHSSENVFQEQKRGEEYEDKEKLVYISFEHYSLIIIMFTWIIFLIFRVKELRKSFQEQVKKEEVNKKEIERVKREIMGVGPN